jgi:Na+-driven multidrug efflux pump
MLETLFVIFRVIAIGVGVTITQALGGRQAEATRRTALADLGECIWAGAAAALALRFFSDATLQLLNAPDEVEAMSGRYLPLVSLAIGWACEIMVGHLVGSDKFRMAHQLVPNKLSNGVLASGTLALIAAAGAPWLIRGSLMCWRWETKG